MKNIKRKHGLVLIHVIVLLMGSCGGIFLPHAPQDDLSVSARDLNAADTSLNIVAANTIIQDVVESVTGTEVAVIVSGAEDPHSYEPTSSEVSALDEADVIFRLGLDHIEPWWETEWEDAVVKGLVSDDMLLEDPLLEEDGEEAHAAAEEVHQYNPHVWMDPNHVIEFTNTVEKTMVSQDSSNADTYEKNAASYRGVLYDLLNDIEDAKKDFSGLKVVINHPAFLYLFELLEIERIATVEKGEGKEPSADDIASIIDKMNEQDVNLIIADPQHESQNVYEIARSTNSKIALLTSLLNVEVTWDGEQKVITTYKQMIEYDLWALANPEDPPSIFASWWIFLLIGIPIVAVIVVLFIMRRRD